MTAALQNTLETLNSMARCELAIARLYRECAGVFHQDEAFWLGLESEEMKHAGIINELTEMIQKAPDRFQANRAFSAAAIQTMVSGIEQNIDQLKSGLLDRRKMLIIARDIEASIIEKLYHEIVKTTEQDFLSLIRTVVSETFRHKTAIDNKLREAAA